MGELDVLGLDNILGEDEVETLFTSPDNIQDQEETSDEENEEVTSDEEEPVNKKNKTTEVVNPETLFEEEKPESVGSGKKHEGAEDAVPSEDTNSTSPTNFYSSIANALAVDGVFPNLNDDAVKKAVDAESFSDLIEAEIQARLDDKQLRISKALDNGVEPTDIKKYENTLSYIASITDANIAAETEEGEQLRRNLIYQDFLNKGMSAAKAQKLTNRTIDAGTDVEDAKEALISNKEYFTDAYNQLLQDAQDEADAAKAERKKQADQLQKSLMNDNQLFGDIDINKDLRKKAFDSIAKPIYRDPETGQYLTALQKYEMEHRADFLKYVGLMYSMTDGFKDFNSFTKGRVKKEMKKGLRDLEQTLSNTRRATDGSLRMIAGVKEDPESFFTKGMKLDL